MQIFKARQSGVKREERLDSRTSLLRANDHHPGRLGFRALRALHDDRFEADSGLSAHGLRDIEVISYVIAGEFEHRDSLGNHLHLGPGSVLHLSAGTGMTHEAFRARSGAPARFVQMWLLPRRSSLAPSCQSRTFERPHRPGQPRLLLSPDGRDGSLPLQSDASIWAGALGLHQRMAWAVEDGRHGWVQVVSGALAVGGQEVGEGDGVAIKGHHELALEGLSEDAEVLLLDLA